MTEHDFEGHQSVIYAIQGRLHADLSREAENRLKRIFADASGRIEERSFAEFQQAVTQLADQLPGALEHVRMRRDVPSGRDVSLTEFRAAFKSVCPLWPFCQ